MIYLPFAKLQVGLLSLLRSLLKFRSCGAIHILISCLQLNAKEQQQLSYNIKRGIEALNNEQYSDALNYFNQDIKDNPKNSFAYCMLAIVHTINEDYGEALTAVSTAVKYRPKNDKQWVGLVYETRAKVYIELDDTIAAINDLTQAIKACPTDYSYYNQRGELYFYTQQYKSSDADYLHMLQSDDSKNIRDALMGLGRNQLRQGYTDNALKIYNRVIQLYNDDAVAYSWRGETYLEQKKYNEGADDLITALRISNNNKAFYLMRHLESEQAYMLMRLKMKKEQAKEPNNGRWYSLI